MSIKTLNLTLGYFHSCASRRLTHTSHSHSDSNYEYEFKCWGLNDRGQCDIQSQSSASSAIHTLHPRLAAAGLDFTCISNSDVVMCTASDSDTIIKNSTVTNTDKIINTPDVDLILDKIPRIGEKIILLAAGSIHLCLAGNRSALKCWGDNSHGQTDTSGVGVQPVVRVALGSVHSCVLYTTLKI